MITTPEFVFCRIEKTGSVFLKDFFLKHIPQAKESRANIGAFGSSGHFGLYHKPLKKLTFCGIRNPYTWYPSYYNMLLKDPKHNGEYDLRSLEHFVNDVFNRQDRGLYWNYEFINDNKIGLLTHQWLKIACRNTGIPYELDIKAECLMDYIYRQEHLVEDVLSFLNLSDAQKEAFRTSGPKNVGSYADGTEGLTGPLRDLIRDRDRIIFERFPEYGL